MLERLGWRVVRQRGSHAIPTREGRSGLISVPLSRQEIAVGTIGNIIRKAGLTRRQLDSSAREVL